MGILHLNLTFFKNMIYYGRNPPGDSISGPTPTRKGGSSLYLVKGIPVRRVIAYIDGYNLYYGLRTKRWKWFYWLNVQSMARRSHTFIGRNVLSNSVFPDQVVKPDGFVLHRPAEWR